MGNTRWPTRLIGRTSVRLSVALCLVALTASATVAVAGVSLPWIGSPPPGTTGVPYVPRVGGSELEVVILPPYTVELPNQQFLQRSSGDIWLADGPPWSVPKRASSGTAPGTVRVVPGTVKPNVEQTFYIMDPQWPGTRFVTGPGTRNQDYQVANEPWCDSTQSCSPFSGAHAAVWYDEFGTGIIGFEDVWGGGDEDYNDAMIAVAPRGHLLGKGFVTGGGWITLPSGNLAGRDNFGFVGMNGKDGPRGQTQFEIRSGDKRFHSTEYYVVAVSTPKGTVPGRATIIGEGRLTEGKVQRGAPFYFWMELWDYPANGKKADEIWMRIWQLPSTPLSPNVYQTFPPLELEGGQIVIHYNK